MYKKEVSEKIEGAMTARLASDDDMCVALLATISREDHPEAIVCAISMATVMLGMVATFLKMTPQETWQEIQLLRERVGPNANCDQPEGTV